MARFLTGGGVLDSISEGLGLGLGLGLEFKSGLSFHFFLFIKIKMSSDREKDQGGSGGARTQKTARLPEREKICQGCCLEGR